MKCSKKCKEIFDIINDEFIIEKGIKLSVCTDNPEENHFTFRFGKNYDGLEMSFGLDLQKKGMKNRIIYCKKFPPVAFTFKLKTLKNIEAILLNNIEDIEEKK